MQLLRFRRKRPRPEPIPEPEPPPDPPLAVDDHLQALLKFADEFRQQNEDDVRESKQLSGPLGRAFFVKAKNKYELRLWLRRHRIPYQFAYGLIRAVAKEDAAVPRISFTQAWLRVPLSRNDSDHVHEAMTLLKKHRTEYSLAAIANDATVSCLPPNAPWQQLGGALSASGRPVPESEAPPPSDQRERSGQNVASHPPSPALPPLAFPIYNLQLDSLAHLTQPSMPDDTLVSNCRRLHMLRLAIQTRNESNDHFLVPELVRVLRHHQQRLATPGRASRFGAFLDLHHIAHSVAYYHLGKQTPTPTAKKNSPTSRTTQRRPKPLPAPSRPLAAQLFTDHIRIRIPASQSSTLYPHLVALSRSPEPRSLGAAFAAQLLLQLPPSLAAYITERWNTYCPARTHAGPPPARLRMVVYENDSGSCQQTNHKVSTASYASAS